LAGVILVYTLAKESPGTTKDRVLDHIGFEVKNLGTDYTFVAPAGGGGFRGYHGLVQEKP